LEIILGENILDAVRVLVNIVERYTVEATIELPNIVEKRMLCVIREEVVKKDTVIELPIIVEHVRVFVEKDDVRR
jgi:hypothetical protein